MSYDEDSERGREMKKVIHCYYELSPTMTKAQVWICRVLNSSGFTQEELGKKLHISRQAVNNLVNGHSKLTFSQVCAICYVCYLADDPESIWQDLNKE